MCRAMEARPMDICRIGLIGAGNVARRHAKVLSGFPDVRIAGITDVVPQALTTTVPSNTHPARELFITRTLRCGCARSTDL